MVIGMNAIAELRLFVYKRHEGGGIGLSETQEIFCYLERIEDEYMELPKDKNGEVIHVGDKVNTPRIHNNEIVVGVGTLDFNGRDAVFVYNEQAFRWVGEYTNECELVKPDSMERIKADALKGFTYYWDCPEICPEECRGRDEYPEVCCMTAQTLDLIARTEKLLGGEQ